MVSTAPRLSSPALAAVVVTVLAWASAFVAIRAVGQSYDAGPRALGRLVVGALALGVGVLL
ncbi:MAG: EamA/RhaT family transporter, partial [Pseudonocardia sp.]|nr:EamA/RhaT family transporter [Pseudonocardia sp.]